MVVNDIRPLPDIPFNTLNTPWGTPLSHCQPMLERIHQERVRAGHAPDWPFADYLEFEFVKWMVVNDISQTARDKLIKLPIMEHCELSFSSNYALNKLLDKLPAAGPRWRRIERTIIGTLKDAKGENFLKEQIEIWVRDIIEVIRELIGNTTYGSKLVFVPWRVELNGDPLQRKIDEMWTADWWMRIQNQLPPGATVIPIILSSDATQLTNFSGGKSAWPVYISIGNIPKSIHAKISSYSTLLLAYLPVPKFDCFPAKERGDQDQHGNLPEMPPPPRVPAHTAVTLKAHTMIAGCHQNLCHHCTVKQDQRGNLPEMPPPPWVPAHTAVALEAHDHGHTSSLFDNQGLKPFGKPFWADLPYANIFSSLTPDILHQLHKGVFKDHLMEWCLKLIKHTGGSVDNTTVKEHREMQKVFTAVMAGLVPDDVLPVIVAAIGFIHFARLPSHTTATLALLDDALECFHAHKDVFIKYKIRTNFNINKIHAMSHYIHAMSHYVEAILELGAADAYNTETPERLHIDLSVINNTKGFNSTPGWKLAKKSPFPLAPVSLLPEAYSINWFEWCMQEFFEMHYHQNTEMSPEDLLEVYPKATQVINDAFVTELVDLVHAYPKATQVINDAFVTELVDLVHASPARPGGPSTPRFDTVLIRRGDASKEPQLSQPSYGIKSHYIGRVKLIFRLPPHYGIQEPLILIQIFRITTYTRPNKCMGMFKVSHERFSDIDGDGTYQERVVPLSHIRRSCHLVPEFGDDTPLLDAYAPSDINSNILDNFIHMTQQMHGNVQGLS
ncbi:hypothetical protein RSAG8_12651, partial [Rhizoctonia solani AG-8 WAC10335]